MGVRLCSALSRSPPRPGSPATVPTLQMKGRDSLMATHTAWQSGFWLWNPRSLPRSRCVCLPNLLLGVSGWKPIWEPPAQHDSRQRRAQPRRVSQEECPPPRSPWRRLLTVFAAPHGGAVDRLVVLVVERVAVPVHGVMEKREVPAEGGQEVITRQSRAVPTRRTVAEGRDAADQDR